MVGIGVSLLLLLYPWARPSIKVNTWLYTPNSGCISLLLPRLPELPSRCYSNGHGSLDSLGCDKEVHLCITFGVIKHQICDSYGWMM